MHRISAAGDEPRYSVTIYYPAGDGEESKSAALRLLAEVQKNLAETGEIGIVAPGGWRIEAHSIDSVARLKTAVIHIVARLAVEFSYLDFTGIIEELDAISNDAPQFSVVEKAL